MPASSSTTPSAKLRPNLTNSGYIRRRRHLLGWYAALVVVCTGWGTIPIVVRDVHLDGAAITFVRVWLAAAGLSAVLAFKPAVAAGPRLFSASPVRTITSGVVLAAHWSAMFAGYKRAPADTVIFVVFLAPVAVAALAPIFLGERLGLRTVSAVALGVAGLALVALPSAEAGDAIGLAYAGVAAVTFAVLLILVKPLAVVYGGLRLTLIEMIIAGVCLIPIALTLDWGRPAAAWLWLIVLGLVHTGMGTAIYLAALAHVPTTHGGILGYLEPLGVVVFSWMLLGDIPTLATVAGGILIVGSGAIVVLSSTDATIDREAASVPR